MAQNNKAVQTPKANPAGSFSMRMGSTTYIIGVHFSTESKDTLEEFFETWTPLGGKTLAERRYERFRKF